MDKDQLNKGLAKLQAAAQDGNANARREELFQKAQSGNITAEENEELLKSLGGGGIKDDITSSFTQPSESMQKSIDVSDSFRDYVGAVVDGLDKVADTLAKSEARDDTFRIALATSLHAQGEIMKSMADKLESMQKSLDNWGSEPARGPKTVGLPADKVTVEKSMAGGAPAGNQLGREEILDGFDSLIQKGEGSVNGEDLVKAAAKFESLNQISSPVLERITQFTREQNQAA